MAAPKIGILGQGVSGAATNVDIYTVPGARRAVVSTVAICNTTGVDKTFRIHARIGGAAVGTGNAVQYDAPVLANQTAYFTIGMTLAANDVLTCQGNAVGVTFTAFGEETDVPAA